MSLALLEVGGLDIHSFVFFYLFLSSEAFYLYYIPRKRIQVFSLLCFVLLLYGPYASSGFQYSEAKLMGWEQIILPFF